MKTAKTLALVLIVFIPIILEGATIKFFSDYPNSVPIGSDFFVLQRNNSYINASRDQVKNDWFNNPVFTGTVTGITNISFITVTATTNINNYDFTTNLIVNNEFVTNLTIEVPGGFTNLNLTPNTVMYSDVNDAESSIPNAVGVLTNNGTGGIGFNNKIQLDEIDAQNFFPTNLFTGLTNFAVLGTDANGLLTVGSSTITNISITNAYIQLLTNFTLVNTNLFISTSNSFFNNTTITNANFTNAYFISGKGNTLIITNNLNLQYLTASKLVATDGAKNLTNADVSADLTFSGNVVGLGTKGTAGTYTKTTFDANGRETSGTSAVLASSDFANQGTTTTVLHGNAAGNPSWTSVANADLANSSITIQGSAVSLGGSTLAAGATPAFGAINITNYNYVIATNNGGGSALVGGAIGTAATLYLTNITAATTLASFTWPTTVGSGIKMYVTCSGGTDRILTFPNGCTGAGLGTPPAVTITNAKAAYFDVLCIPGVSTNVFWSPVF